MAENRVQVLHLHPALLDTMDTGQNRAVIGCPVLMTSFSLRLMKTMAMMVKIDGVFLPFQSRTTAVRSLSTRSISVRLWRISSTFTSTLRSRRFVYSLFSCDSEGRNLKSPVQVSERVCVCCIQVLLELTQQMDEEKTILSLSICQLGAEGKRRSFDLSVTSYLRRVSLDYCDVPGNRKVWFWADSCLHPDSAPL